MAQRPREMTQGGGTDSTSQAPPLRCVPRRKRATWRGKIHPIILPSGQGGRGKRYWLARVLLAAPSSSVERLTGIYGALKRRVARRSKCTRSWKWFLAKTRLVEIGTEKGSCAPAAFLQEPQPCPPVTRPTRVSWGGLCYIVLPALPSDQREPEPVRQKRRGAAILPQAEGQASPAPPGVGAAPGGTPPRWCRWGRSGAGGRCAGSVAGLKGILEPRLEPTGPATPRLHFVFGSTDGEWMRTEAEKEH